MFYLKLFLGLLGLLTAAFLVLGLKSQKGSAPGLVDGKLSPCSAKPNCVCSEAGTSPEHDVQPLRGTLKQARQAILDTGGTITSESDDYISATYMSRIFKFVDDVELRRSGPETVQIRSASRVGYSDRGVNRRRVEAIRQAMSQIAGHIES